MSGPADLSALNPVERRFLLLLAHGHTVKSIANREGCSPGAVNERLREARRKTGLGSSREVARALLAQENRDEQIGVVTLGQVGASTASQARTPAPRRWIMPLLALGGVLTLVAAVMLSSQNPASREDALTPQTERVAQYLDAERRDAAWATPIEAAMLRRFADFTALTGTKVRCAATICEVTAAFATGDRGATNDSMARLQGAALRQHLERLGLTHQMSSFGNDKQAAGRGRYVSYWLRAAVK